MNENFQWLGGIAFIFLLMFFGIHKTISLDSNEFSAIEKTFDVIVKASTGLLFMYLHDQHFKGR